MLKIEKTTESSGNAVEIDYYVPFTISFGRNEFEDCVCPCFSTVKKVSTFELLKRQFRNEVRNCNQSASFEKTRIKVSGDILDADFICWRIGDFYKSLLEFSIERKSRRLKEVVLVATSKVSLTDEGLDEIDEKESGIPTVEFQEVENQLIYDNYIDFETVLGRTYIKTFWSEKTKLQLRIGRVLLGIDDDNRLTSITITELSDFEYNELKESLILKSERRGDLKK